MTKHDEKGDGKRPSINDLRFNVANLRQIRDSQEKAIAMLTRAVGEIAAQRNDLLEACKNQHDAMDWLFAYLASLDRKFLPSQSHAWAAFETARETMKRIKAAIGGSSPGGQSNASQGPL
jgi:hypothetical protein